MLELYKKLLIEYQRDYEKNKSECFELYKSGKPWKEHAEKGAGLKLMIEGTLLKIKEEISS